MAAGYEPSLEDSIEIAAPPAEVWAVVSDLRRMAEWSPQVESTRLRNGAQNVALGVEFTNLNSQGELKWTTHGTVVRMEPDREVAFRIEENWAVWSFRLEPTRAGTKLTQQRETPDGISEYSLQVTDAHLGGQQVFTETLRAGMHETLAAIKAALE
ncbi:MAG: SRPBCC family protein [Mycobacterium sp.]|nr:SRPBCC family protein [Mycobacterium sp.]